MNLGKVTLMATAAALFGVSHAVAAPVTIDSFDTDQGVSTHDISSGSAVSEVMAGGTGTILGEWRDLIAEVETSNGDFTYQAVVDAGDNDNLVINSDSGVDGVTTVQWDGEETTDVATLDKDGMSARDLEDGGLNDRLSLGVVVSDLDTMITFNVYSGENAGSTLEKTVNSTSSVVDFEFEDFAQITGTSLAADFSAVTAVEMIVDTPSNGDVTLDFVESNAIPAPAALPAGLVLLSGMGVFRLRGRRRA